MSRRKSSSLITHHSSLITFLAFIRFDDEHGAVRVADDRLGGRAEEDATQARAPVRRDDDQVGAALLRHPDDLRGRLAVGDYLLDIEALALRRLHELRQLAR